MSASSINRKVAEIEKAKKVERRNALNERNKPVNDQPKHIEAPVREVPAKTSSSDSIVESGKIKAKPKNSFFKKKAKKSS
jgi:hypothetical protein